jgi:hypothetical protein
MAAAITTEGPRRSRTTEGRAPVAGVASRHRKTSVLVGVLFIIGDIAGVLSVLVTGGLLDGPHALTRIAAQQDRLVLGALLVLVMGLALAMVPVVLFPLFRKVNEVLALGCVVFRGALEAVAYMASAGTLLLLVELGREAAAAGDARYQSLSGLLVAAQGSVVSWLIAIAFSLGSLMFYYLFYRSRLVPRWLSVWGLVGAVLYLATPLLDMSGHGFGILMAPLAVAEVVLAVWLIVRGLDAGALNGMAA